MYSRNFSLLLFGPFEARYNDQLLTNFATDKIRALLAYLAIEADTPHRRETLATLLWPNYPNEISLRNLRQSLYRLRRTLQEVDPILSDQLITQDRLTIILNSRAVSLDVFRFKQTIQAVRHADDPFPHLEQIASLYRGDLLLGLSIAGAYAFEEWLNIQREVFRQQTVEVLTHLLDIYETRHNYDDLVNIASKLLTIEPWHEETHRQLMRAYLKRGNHSQAIAHYQEFQTSLLSELGVGPSPATIALYKQIETGTTQKPVPTSAPQHNHIPHSATPLIGRETELDHLTQTLQNPACRLLTITGLGGIGKTRLCIEASHQLALRSKNFPQGLHFISLAHIERGDQLVTAIAQVLELTLHSRTKQQQELVNHLKGQNILLLLDNFEHLLSSSEDEVLPSATTFVMDLLASTTKVKLLVTSRVPLEIKNEWVLPLEGLPYSHSGSANHADVLNAPAPQLFIQNARRHNASFDPSLDARAILEICRLTDGMPLAIEMAATWMRIHTCQEIADTIAQNLDFLASPFRDVPVRQRSIRVILNSTWDQLTREQQNTLMALSVFRGGFSIQAALSVSEASILELSTLVAKSFLRRTDDNRYFLHELVNQFANEKLTETGTGDQVHERHALFYFTELSEQIIAFSGSNPVDAIKHIRRDLDNLRVAWNWSALQTNLPLLEKGMKGLTQFWIFSGANMEGEANVKKAITAVQKISQDPYTISIYSYLTSSLAWLQMGIGKNDEAEKNLQEALQLAEQGNNLEMRAVALSLQGWLLQNQSHFDEAETVLREACSIFEQTGNQFQLSLALIRMGSVYWWKNQLETSLKYYEQSLHIEQSLGNKRGINRALGGLGLAYMELEKFEQALEYLEKALQLDRELGNQPGIVRNIGHMGNIYLQKGMYELAVACYQEALEVEQNSRGKSTSANWLSSLGRVHFRQRNYEKALACYEEAILFAKENGSRHQLSEALLGKADIYIEQGRLDDAHDLIEDGLTLSYEIGRKDTKLRGIILKARWLSRTGEPQKARQLLESSRETLASEYKESETNAHFFFELWKIDHRIEDAKEALRLYEACQARAEQMEYTERIAELTSSLHDHL